MQTRGVGWGWLAAATVLLAACGGGGGTPESSSGGIGGAIPASPSTPGNTGTGGATSSSLAITAANAGSVAGRPLWAGESVMRIGYVISQELQALAANASLAHSGDCGSSGTWQRTLTDGDASGSLSAGDRVNLNFGRCAREPIANSADGSVNVTLVSVAANGSLVARVTLPAPGLGLSYSREVQGAAEYRVTGSFRLDAQRTDTRTSWVISADAGDDLLIEFPGSFAPPGDHLRNFRLEKSHHWDEARTVIDLRMLYDSPELGGNFEVSTPVPLRAWLEALPEPHAQQGHFEMRGRNGDLVQLGVIGGEDGVAPQIAVALDQGGNGSIEATGEGRWFDPGLLHGYLFADYSPGRAANTLGYSSDDFAWRQLFSVSTPVPVDSVLRVQFTRPPAGTADWRWRLIDRGQLPFAGGAGTEVPVQVEVRGALVLVRPQQSLRYSRNYELLLDSGTPTSSGQLLRASTGASRTLYAGTFGSFQTPDYLNPRIYFQGSQQIVTASQPVVLGPLAPAAGAPAVSYHWVQLSGTPLLIDQPAQRQVSVRLAGSGVGVGSATLRLTVSLADGSSESGDFVVRTLHSGGPWVSLLYVPSMALTWPERLLWGGPAVGTLTAMQQGDSLRVNYSDTAGPADRYPNWAVMLRSADGQPLRPGRYTNAWSTAIASRPEGVPSLDYTLDTSSFSPRNSEFEIFELAFDASGQVTQLAMDFIARDVYNYTQATGSVRINSTRPPAGQAP